LPTEEFENSDYRANDGRRCYFCKQTLYSSIALHRDRLGFRTIVNGTNCDDLGDYRPGLIAAEEHEVRSPLVEAGFHKQDVRQLAREWNIPIWDKPASPCLSSRVAYGVEVTPQRVERIDAGERFLRELLKVKELRVRLEAGELARIELPIEHLIQLTDPQVRQQVVDYFLQLGFNCITLDLAGFRSGGFNSRLEQNDLVRLTTMPRQ
ncbi:MAG: ATP-dependent sacrificial sulfur transferase LarE, partial [Planctomycetaceae bacterium]|nr:ATP-dependent sacrificial sulfur transferase LarE [Planctomycetaceae bacterium]